MWICVVGKTDKLRRKLIQKIEKRERKYSEREKEERLLKIKKKMFH